MYRKQNNLGKVLTSEYQREDLSPIKRKYLIPSKPTETRVISHFFKRRKNRESTIGDRHFDNYGCSLHFFFRNYHLCHHYRKLASQVTEFAEEKREKNKTKITKMSKFKART